DKTPPPPRHHVCPAFAEPQAVAEELSPLAIPTGRHGVDAEDGREVTGDCPAAELIGEAVLALLDAGESLGPPLVVPLESVLQPPDDPREALDYSYQRQLESLTRV